jgi:hypothetical protein
MQLQRCSVIVRRLKKNSLPPVNWRWVEEGDGYVGPLQPHGQPLGVGLPSGLQCLVPYPYREALTIPLGVAAASMREIRKRAPVWPACFILISLNPAENKMEF